MRLSKLFIVATALVLILVLLACSGLSEADKHYNAGVWSFRSRDAYRKR